MYNNSKAGSTRQTGSDSLVLFSITEFYYKHSLTVKHKSSLSNIIQDTARAGDRNSGFLVLGTYFDMRHKISYEK